MLGLDAVTVARSRHRLTEAGAAWISCSPTPALAATGQGLLAVAEVDCAGGSLLTVARALAELPHVTAVEHVGGDRDLLLTVMATELAALTHWVTRGIGAMQGIVATRTHLANTIYTEGSRWRLRALDRPRIARLAEAGAPRADTPSSPSPTWTTPSSGPCP
ncbi:Lrp/AsnC ligand binding domain-containing protein [Streptomyces sp. NPDC052164]|uniref:Lrp/AsnC family transcriptional regulator n=1 Tax=Streptomyces sp. NPDC052164 TaxID=3155529 RepID=UPI0034144642